MCSGTHKHIPTPLLHDGWHIPLVIIILNDQCIINFLGIWKQENVQISFVAVCSFLLQPLSLQQVKNLPSLGLCPFARTKNDVLALGMGRDTFLHRFNITLQSVSFHQNSIVARHAKRNLNADCRRNAQWGLHVRERVWAAHKRSSSGSRREVLFRGLNKGGLQSVDTSATSRQVDAVCYCRRRWQVVGETVFQW